MFDIRQSWPEGLRFVLFWVIATLNTLYVFRFAKPLKTTRSRLLVALPVFALNFVVPSLLFSPDRRECITVLLTWCITAWIGNFRLLSFCFHRGRLVNPRLRRRFFLFMVTLYFPIRIRPKPKNDSKQLASEQMAGEEKAGNFASGSWDPPSPFPRRSRSRSELLQGVCLKLTLAYLTCHYYSVDLNPYLLLSLQACMLYLLLGFEFDLFGLIVSLVTRSVVIEPHFNLPFLASSLHDFWARRWNLTISGCLRETVYEPVVILLTPQRTLPGVRKRLSGQDRQQPGVHPEHLLSCYCNGSKAGIVGRSKIPGGGAEVEHMQSCDQQNDSQAHALGGMEPRAAVVTGPDVDPSQQDGSHAGMPARTGGDAQVSPENRGESVAVTDTRAVRPPVLASMCGQLAAFFVSGIMHELLFFALGGGITGEMTFFFSLHGVLTVAEALLKQWLAGAYPELRIPHSVSLPATLTVLFLTAQRWFLGPYGRHVLTLIVQQVLAAFGHNVT